VPFFKRNRVDR